jgi:hypothetical protein
MVLITRVSETLVEGSRNGPEDGNHRLALLDERIFAQMEPQSQTHSVLNNCFKVFFLQFWHKQND